MKTLRTIIRLYCYGTALKAMETMVRASRNTIKKYIRIWNTLGLSYEEFCERSDSELALLFSVSMYSTPSNPRLEALEEKLPEYCKKLGCSQLTYVEATQSQRKEDFICSCEKTVADAILDRIVHRAMRVELVGESMRKRGVGQNDDFR